MMKDTVVMNNLNESCEFSELSKNSMNEATHKRLGFYISGLLGNITPDTAEFVEDAVMAFIDPAIYQEVKQAIALQLGELVEDQVVMTFSPESFILEDGVVFITGKGELQGPAGKPEKFIRTYEIEFYVSNYTPLVRYINVYNDVAHDSLWEAKNRKKAEKLAKKENRKD